MLHAVQLQSHYTIHKLCMTIVMIKTTTIALLCKVFNHDHSAQTHKIHRFDNHANDPSAGSPTETLLRLLLPLSDKVHKIFHNSIQDIESYYSPNSSPDHSIGRSDGRCVQRAGT